MRKKDIYIYPAVFSYADDGISISFPDLPGCISCGFSDEECMRMAKEALGVYMWTLEDEQDSVPAPTPLNQVDVQPDERAVLIEVYMPLIRDAVDSKAVKKTLTIPAWMDEAAKAENINFSKLLQSSIVRTLQRSSAGAR